MNNVVYSATCTVNILAVNGYCYVVNTYNNKYLTASTDIINGNTNVIVQDYLTNKSPRQMWHITQLQNGNYSYKPMSDESKGMHVYDSASSQSNVDICTIGSTPLSSFQWTMISSTNGYIIRNVQNNYVLDAFSDDNVCVNQNTGLISENWCFVTVDSVKIISSKNYIAVNETYTGLTAQAIYNGNPVSVTWQSSNTSIATINNSGVVTGVAAGEVVITAAYNNLSATLIMSVTIKPISFTPGIIDSGGLYKITNLDSDLSLKASPNNVIQSIFAQSNHVRTDQEQWIKITYIGNGEYTLKLYESNNYISTSSNGDLYYQTLNTFTSTRWYIETFGNSTYEETYFVNKQYKHLYLATNVQNNTGIISCSTTNTHGKWKLTRLDQFKVSGTYDCTFYIKHNKNEMQCLAYIDVASNILPRVFTDLSFTSGPIETHDNNWFICPNCDPNVVNPYNNCDLNCDSTSGCVMCNLKCNLETKCGTTCTNSNCCGSNEHHNKDVANMNNRLITYFAPKENTIFVSWMNRANNTLCSYYNGEHEMVTWYGVVYGRSQYIHMLKSESVSNYSAFYSLVLAHEVTHCMGVGDQYDNEGHDTLIGFKCIMERFDSTLFISMGGIYNYIDFYNNILNETVEPYCESCHTLVDASVVNRFFD